jgi:hypothetical protein
MTREPDSTDVSMPGRPVQVRPGDPRYGDLSVRHANARWVSTPEAFVLVGSTDQVVQVVQDTVRSEQSLVVRSSGHCYEDFINAGPQVVLDLAEMNRIYFDPARDAFAVEAGAPLLDVYRRLFFGWGVTIPGGSCGTVAVGGHVSGGGYGALSRQFGLTVDHLEAVEVVVVDADGSARAVVATRDPADPYHDLWWAHTGGGGGNFGVATRYWFRTPGATGNPGDLLPRPPATILSSRVMWPWAAMDSESFHRIVRNHGEWHERNSAPDSPYTGLYGGLVLFGREPGDDPGMACISFAQIDGTTPDARRLLDSYVAEVGEGVTAPAISPPVTEAPWMALATKQSKLQDTQGLRLKLKAADLRRRYTDAQITTLHDELHRIEPSRGQATVSFQSYGGRVAAVAPEETATVQRDSILKVLYYSTWEDPALDAPAVDWLRRTYRAVYAGTGGVPVPGEVDGGSFINFPDNDLADPEWNASGVAWHDLYYQQNYARLQRAKAEWDPRDVFRHTLSVRAAG